MRRRPAAVDDPLAAMPRCRMLFCGRGRARMSMNKIGMLLAAAVMVGALAHGARADGQEFDGAGFTCLNYTNGLGENASNKMQSTLAHLWIQGYLAGVYKAKGNLQLSEDKADDDKLSAVMLQRCRDNPQATILAVSLQRIADEPRKLPAKTVVDFTPATHTCAQQTAARKGSAGEANKADLADL